MKSHIVRRFVAGVVLFVPISVLSFGLFYAYRMGKQFLEPIFGVITVSTLFDLLLLNVAALAVVAVFVYLLGYLAELSFIANRVQKLDRALSVLVPGYAIIKGIVGGVVDEESLLEGLRPVVVEQFGGLRLGFETDRSDDGMVVVFLPDTPMINRGIAIAIDASKVQYLDIPPHRVLDIQSFYGRELPAEIRRAKEAVTTSE